jgi:hypothetical protein
MSSLECDVFLICNIESQYLPKDVLDCNDDSESKGTEINSMIIKYSRFVKVIES